MDVAPAPLPVLPSYEGASLAGLVPALLAPAGRRPRWVPEPAQAARQVVLLVVDGLGWEQLAPRRRLAPTLAGMVGGPITSVVPTTTATALTSITVGAPPAAHGVVGYRVVVAGPTGAEVLNVLRWRTVSGDARSFVAPEELQPLPPFGGRPVPVVSRREFDGTAFTAAHQRHTRPASWALPSGMAVEVRRLLRDGEPFVYAYYDGVDKIAHLAGFGDLYDAELVALDRLIGDLLTILPPGAALAVTADHGQVEVGARAVPLDPAVMDEVHLLSGEARFRWLHARPGRVEALLAAATATYGEEAWVVTCDEVDACGWFGGTLAPAVRARLGDVAVVPHRPVAYLDPVDPGDARLICRHGSLTSDEMLVPLLGAGPP